MARRRLAGAAPFHGRGGREAQQAGRDCRTRAPVRAETPPGPPPEPAGDARRFKLLTEATMTARQRESYQAIVSGPRKGATGPFNALLRSPEGAGRGARGGGE